MSQARSQALIKDIEASLKSSPKQLEKFRALIADFKSNNKSPTEVFAEISKLCGSNPKVAALLQSPTLQNFEQLSQFVRTVKTSLQDSSGKSQPALEEFTRLITLLVDGMIPVPFFEHCVHHLTSSLKSQSRRDIDAELAKLLKVEDWSFLRHVRKQMITDGTMGEFVLDADVEPNLLVQLLVMAGISCSEAATVRVLKALDLYGFNLLTIDGVYHLLKPIDENIATVFEDAAQNTSHEAFFPSAVFEHMKKEFKPHQVKWLLGDSLFEKLEKWPENHKSSLMEVAMAMREDARKQWDQSPAAAAPYIVELQAKTMFKGLKSMIESIRADGDLKVPDEIISAICEPEVVQRDELFDDLMFEKCQEFGADAHSKQMMFLTKKLELLDPSSTDWRVEFKAKLNKNFCKRNLVFVGTKYPLGPKKAQCITLCKQFLTHFSELQEMKAIKVVKKLLAGGEFDLDESGALMLHYFGEVLDLMRNTDLTDDVVKSIADRFFVEDAPLREFHGSGIANADIPLRYFATYLKKAIQNCPDQFARSAIVIVPDCFGYHTSVKSGSVSIRGYPNAVTIVIAVCTRSFVNVLIFMLGSWAIGMAIAFPATVNERLITDLGYTPSELGLFGSLTSLTATLGPLIATPALKFRGKRFTCQLISVINVFAYLIVLGTTGMRRSLPIVSRAIVGFAAGSYSCFIPTCITDCATMETKDFYCIMHQLGMTLGIIFTMGVGPFVHWKVLAFLGTIPSLLLMVFVKAVPESMQRFGRMALPDSVATEKSGCCGAQRVNAIIAFFFIFFQQASSVNAMLTTLQDYLVYRTGPIIATSAQALGVIFCLVLFFKFGRKVAWLVSCLGAATALSLSKYLVSWEQRTNDETKVTIAAAFVFMMFYTIGLGPIPFIVVTDLYPDVGHASVFSSIYWFLSFVAIVMTPNLVLRTGREKTIMVYLSLVLIGGVFGTVVLGRKPHKEQPFIGDYSP